MPTLPALSPGTSGRSRSGPCSPWASRDDMQFVGPCAFGLDGNPGDVPDEGTLDRALLMASTILFRLSGANWTGPCTDTVRPVLSPRYGWMMVGGFYGPPVDLYASASFGDLASMSGNMVSRWFPYGWSSEAPLGEIRLLGPVVSPDGTSPPVQEVKVDGAVLDPSRYQVIDRNLLVRTDGLPWPALQDVHLPDTQPGTLSVTYTFGKLPPPDAVTACAILACEIARSWMPDAEGTRLPRNITTMTGEGMTMQVIDPATAFLDGNTGIPEVDLWLASVRSTRRRPVLLSADGWARSRLRRWG